MPDKPWNYDGYPAGQSSTAAMVGSRPIHGGKCPFCAEAINPEAIKCRYCGAMLVGADNPRAFQATSVSAGSSPASGSPTGRTWAARDYVAMTGAGLLLVGSFCPVMSAPFVGSISYFKGGSGDGVFTAILAVVAGLLVFFNRARWPWVIGLLAGGVALYDLVDISNRIGGIKGEFSSLVSLEWGWAVIFLGCILMVLAAFIPNQSPQRTN